MRRMTTAQQERERLEFAEKAATYFSSNPNHSTFGELDPGSLLALRWGLGNDCVLVLRLDEFEQAVNFQNIIKKKD